jgi:hypothetical protein
MRKNSWWAGRCNCGSFVGVQALACDFFFMLEHFKYKLLLRFNDIKHGDWQHGKTLG